MNNKEREMWVLNDESWYNAFMYFKRNNHGGMQAFLREYRKDIDEYIDKQLNRSPIHD